MDKTEQNLEKKLGVIFDFLKENRSYNKKVQTKFYTSAILPHESKFDKIVSLLYSISNTQSSSKIDHLAEFFRKMHDNKKSLDSFNGFMSVINSGNKYKNNYNWLFKGMKKQSGWGVKTAALFTKAIYHIHNEEYLVNNKIILDPKIWDDTPKELKSEDGFYLPVDAVIVTIFNQLDERKWNFSNVNEEVKKYYQGKDIEVWDDLWFWGYITQKGNRKNRKMEWNLNKYWALRQSDKNQEKIQEIKFKAEKFLEILSEQNNNKSNKI